MSSLRDLIEDGRVHVVDVHVAQGRDKTITGA